MSRLGRPFHSLAAAELCLVKRLALRAIQKPTNTHNIMIVKILLGLVVLIVVFLIIVATRPSNYRVARSLVIAAPPDAVFPHMNELKKWEAWNPWGKADPNMKLTYAGPASGVGANYSWAGNREAGAGRATITESRPGESVKYKMEFFKPM